jgi:hypothetical protein
MGTTSRATARSRFVSPLLAALSLAAASTAFAADEFGQPMWESKVALRVEPADGLGEPLALCRVRLAEGSSELAIFCRHSLGSEGELALVHAGSGVRSVSPLWSAPLASPFEATVSLEAPALEALLAGELALRIESFAAGVVATGTLGTPIFDSGFEVFSLCEWSNFPCPSDGNVCTDEVCSSTGVCSHPNNTDSCPLPNATGGCFGGNCAVLVSCNSGYSNCDATPGNGCEVAHNTLSASCGSATPTYVGAKGGDQSCGAGCSGTSESIFSTQTGVAERWFRARALENSACTSPLVHLVRLAVPPGVDWDLFVYNDSCELIDSSIEGTGVDEEAGIGAVDFGTGADDSFYYRVEVRHFSGGSCDDWTLSFVGRNCD